MLLAIDPSVNSPGVALFDGDVLIAADRATAPKEWSKLGDGDRWLRVARSIVLWADTACAQRIRIVVFERPQWYQRAKSKGDPNQLAGLAGVAGAVTGILGPHFPTVLSPTPAEWIGQLPKATRGSAKKSPRAARILSRLGENELKLVPDQHDALDAVGLGLWALGRLTPRRVLSNGRDGR